MAAMPSSSRSSRMAFSGSLTFTSTVASLAARPSSKDGST
jgi:hypothetical protein